MDKQKTAQAFLDYLRICGGLLLIALGLDLFLVPNHIAAGGVSGIAVVLHTMFNLPVGASMLLMNMILFVVGFLILGKGFGLRTLVATGLLSLFVDGLAATLPWKTLSDDLLIAVVFGDLLTGLGMAIIFNRNASTGGTDILARIINHYGNINIGRALLLIDFSIAASAGFFLKSVDIGMYSLFAVLINCFAIDAFIDTLNVSKRVLIISSKSHKISSRAMRELDRGGTFIPVEGAFSGNRKQMLMMVIRPRQTAHLREVVKSEDPNAFMVVSNVNQVLGKGFKSFSDPSVEI